LTGPRPLLVHGASRNFFGPVRTASLVLLALLNVLILALTFTVPCLLRHSSRSSARNWLTYCLWHSRAIFLRGGYQRHDPSFGEAQRLSNLKAPDPVFLPGKAIQKTPLPLTGLQR